MQAAPSYLTPGQEGHLNLETLALLHANAVDLVTNGHYDWALQQFRDVLQGLQAKDFAAEDMNADDPRDAFVQVFSADFDGVSEVYSMDDFCLSRPLAVLVQQDRYEGLSQEEISIFSMAALFNIGLCYQIKSQKQSRHMFHERARTMYELAHRSVKSFDVHDGLKSSIGVLGLAICNNLAILYADSYQLEALTSCLEVIQSYLYDIDGNDAIWAHANLFDWRFFKSRHAAVA